MSFGDLGMQHLHPVCVTQNRLRHYSVEGRHRRACLLEVLVDLRHYIQWCHGGCSREKGEKAPEGIMAWKRQDGRKALATSHYLAVQGSHNQAKTV